MANASVSITSPEVDHSKIISDGNRSQLLVHVSDDSKVPRTLDLFYVNRVAA